MHANIHAAGIRAYIRILEACCGVKAGGGEEEERLGGGGKKDETKERRGGTVACGKNKRNNDRTCRSPDFTMQRYRTTQHVGSGLSRLASRLFDN